MTDATRPCAEYEADLSAFLDGEIEAPREALLRAHLESCAACARSAHTLRDADEALRALPSREVPTDLRARLQARIEAESAASSDVRATPRVAAPARRPRRRTLAQPAALLAVAAAAALALYLMVATGERPIPGAEPADIRLATAADLEAASPHELELALELDTVEDMEVISNLELLELLVALEEGAG